MKLLQILKDILTIFYILFIHPIMLLIATIIWMIESILKIIFGTLRELLYYLFYSIIYFIPYIIFLIKRTYQYRRVLWTIFRRIPLRILYLSWIIVATIIKFTYKHLKLYWSYFRLKRFEGKHNKQYILEKKKNYKFFLLLTPYYLLFIYLSLSICDYYLMPIYWVTQYSDLHHPIMAAGDYFLYLLSLTFCVTIMYFICMFHWPFFRYIWTRGYMLSTWPLFLIVHNSIFTAEVWIYLCEYHWYFMWFFYGITQDSIGMEPEDQGTVFLGTWDDFLPEFESKRMYNYYDMYLNGYGHLQWWLKVGINDWSIQPALDKEADCETWDLYKENFPNKSYVPKEYIIDIHSLKYFWNNFEEENTQLVDELFDTNSSFFAWLWPIYWINPDVSRPDTNLRAGTSCSIRWNDGTWTFDYRGASRAPNRYLSPFDTKFEYIHNNWAELTPIVMDRIDCYGTAASSVPNFLYNPIWATYRCIRDTWFGQVDFIWYYTILEKHKWAENWYKSRIHVKAFFFAIYLLIRFILWPVRITSRIAFSIFRYSYLTIKFIIKNLYKYSIKLLYSKVILPILRGIVNYIKSIIFKKDYPYLLKKKYKWVNSNKNNYFKYFTLFFIAEMIYNILYNNIWTPIYRALYKYVWIPLYIMILKPFINLIMMLFTWTYNKIFINIYNSFLYRIYQRKLKLYKRTAADDLIRKKYKFFFSAEGPKESSEIHVMAFHFDHVEYDKVEDRLKSPLLIFFDFVNKIKSMKFVGLKTYKLFIENLILKKYKYVMYNKWKIKLHIAKVRIICLISKNTARDLQIQLNQIFYLSRILFTEMNMINFVYYIPIFNKINIDNDLIINTNLMTKEELNIINKIKYSDINSKYIESKVKNSIEIFNGEMSKLEKLYHELITSIITLLFYKPCKEKINKWWSLEPNKKEVSYIKVDEWMKIRFALRLKKKTFEARLIMLIRKRIIEPYKTWKGVYEMKWITAFYSLYNTLGYFFPLSYSSGNDKKEKASIYKMPNTILSGGYMIKIKFWQDEEFRNVFAFEEQADMWSDYVAMYYWRYMETYWYTIVRDIRKIIYMKYLFEKRRFKIILLILIKPIIKLINYIFKQLKPILKKKKEKEKESIKLQLHLNDLKYLTELKRKTRGHVIYETEPYRRRELRMELTEKLLKKEKLDDTYHPIYYPWEEIDYIPYIYRDLDVKKYAEYTREHYFYEDFA